MMDYTDTVFSEWFNVFGLIFLTVMMIPNIAFAIKNKDGLKKKYSNKAVEIAEQIGRVGCFVFMIFNIPGTWFGWWSCEAFAIYMIANTLMILLYCAIWIICWNKNNVFRALTLSIIPAAIFMFSSVMSRSALLIFAALIFAPTHILISYKNAD